MSLLKKAGLTAAFMVAADLTIASLTGLTGLHGLVVDAGAQLGEFLNIPVFDWGGLVEDGTFNFLEPGAGGHDHSGFLDQINSNPPAPAPSQGW